MRDSLRSILPALGLIACLLAPPVWAVDEPEGFRQSDYAAPVPDTITGGLRIGDEAAFALWRTGVVAFIDVMPDLKRPKGLPDDAIWKGRSRYSVPGAIWLPDAGFGTLDAAAEDRFRTGLVAATQGDRDAPVVFLCRADCWISWNAAKRAIGWGYTRVFWYASGTTGWGLRDYPVDLLKPFQGKTNP